jgi:hypothetical protein
MNALRCPHGRAYEVCVRCDPWCPRDLPEEQYVEMQAQYDKMQNAKLSETLRLFREDAERHGKDKDKP